MEQPDTTAKRRGKILVAPLNWGLGHATRCIPIIKALEAEGYLVVIASDGASLKLLKDEFPGREILELPSYHIRYSSKGRLLKLKLLMQWPHIVRTIQNEKKAVADYVQQNQIAGIISDNRFGVYHKEVPSVFITHQLQVLSGTTTWLSSRAHRKIIDKFDQCWIPDNDGPINLSGKLGHPQNRPQRLRYIGTLSRMQKAVVPIRYDILCLLSGPEPQRSLFEKKLISCFKDNPRKTLLIRGVIDSGAKRNRIGNIEVVSYLTSAGLEEAINASELVISRSGYTSIMDLSVLEKKAFFVPTPGQFEQEYLAKRLKAKGVLPYCKQEDFSLEKLCEVNDYEGFKDINVDFSLSRFFVLFEGKREL